MRKTRPLTRHQQLENAAFLRALRRLGNVTEAVRASGVGYGAMRYRRRCFPDFATRWDAALAHAQARLATGAAATEAAGAMRTAGGEQVVVRLASGKVQVRRAHPGLVTKAAEQAFLRALAATANISLAAAAVGVVPAVFYRRRARDPGFAREMRFALAEGCARLEEALMAGFLPDSHGDDAWRHNDGAAPPALTAEQALQLLALNRRQAQFGWEAIGRRRRKGESADVHAARVRADYWARTRRDAEDERRASLDRLALRLGLSPHEPPLPALPDLGQVTGWSKADSGGGGLGSRAGHLRRRSG